MVPYSESSEVINALYDLNTDPYEMNNLLGSNPDADKYKEKAEELRAKLVGYLKDINYPLVEGVEKRTLIRN